MSGELPPCLEDQLETCDISDVEEYFELDSCKKWCEENNFKNVALQFPDHLLAHSTKVSSRTIL